MTTTTPTYFPADLVRMILVSKWGYEQTNVCYYRIERASPATVWLRRIQTDAAPTGDGMRGTRQPKRDEDGRPIPMKGAELMRRKLAIDSTGDPCIKIDSYEYARPWNGQPQEYTAYA